MMSPTVKSYLKLYTTMDLKKLAGFLEVEPEKLRSWLLVNKQRSRQVRWSEGGLLDGDVTNSSELDYALQGVCKFPPGQSQCGANNDRISFTCPRPRSAEDWWTGTCGISRGRISFEKWHIGLHLAGFSSRLAIRRRKCVSAYLYRKRGPDYVP